MEEINLFEAGKEFADKSKKLRSTGLAFAILNLLFLVGGILVGLVLPLFVPALKSSAIYTYINFFNNLAFVDVYGFIYMGVITALYLGTIAYVIVQTVKMFSAKTRKSGNTHMLAPLLFIALEVLTIHDLCSQSAYGSILPNAVYSDVGIVGLLSLLFSVILPLILIYVYKCVTYFANKGLWEKEGIKIKKLGGLGIASAVVSIVMFGVLFYFVMSAGLFGTESFIKVILSKTYGRNTLCEFLYYFKSLTDVALKILVLASVAVVTWMLVELLRTFGGLLFNCFSISADRNYLRGSKYFNHASPFRTSFLLSLSMFLYMGIMVAGLLIDGSGLGLPYYIGIAAVAVALIVSLVLSIIYVRTAKKDKDELLYGVDFTDNDVDGIDYNKDLVLDGKAANNAPVVASAEEQTTAETENAAEAENAESGEEAAPLEETAEKEPESETAEEDSPEAEEAAPVEEPVKEAIVHETIYAKEDKLEKKAASDMHDMHAQAGMPPYGYPYPPYPQPFMPYPYAPYPMPYPVQPYVQPYPVQPYPPQQPANNSPTIICVPYPMMGNYAPVQAPVQPAPVQPTPAPAPATAPAPAEKAEEEVTATEDVALVIPKKTLEEKFADLKAADKRVYNTIMKYAMAKEGVKRITGTNADVVSFGRDCIVKTQIKSGVIVCSFSLFNYEAKTLIKQEKAVKERLTTIRVVNSDAVDAAKQSIDLAYKLAVEAKEARHQEQLRKRREAKKRKAEENK